MHPSGKSFHILESSNCENQVAFRVAPASWNEKSFEFSCRELTENVLRLLTYIVEGFECQLVFSPPQASEFLLPRMLPIFTWSETTDNALLTCQKDRSIFAFENNLIHPVYGQMGKLNFKTEMPEMFEQQNTILEIAHPFFEQLYRVLFLQAHIGLLKHAYLKMLFTIAETMDSHKANMQFHHSHTAELAKSISIQMECCIEQSQIFYLAGIFHDIGKIIIPQSILHKELSLEEQEWRLIQRHAAFGASLFSPLDNLHPIIPIIRAHHEWYDGTGYPDHLRGAEIPLGARILSIADAYGTMIDGRIYRKKRNPIQAQNELWANRFTQFDPEIVDIFLSKFHTHR
jgi:HD-GYP domain-containing protein (c-di-GMP phosphodiesterase class II)